MDDFVRELTKHLRSMKLPTWPVGADLLFERVRSVQYMELSTSIVLMIWLYQLLGATRGELGNTGWTWHTEFYLKPLYWVAYGDCGTTDKTNTMINTFSLKPCNTTVRSGFVWEILYAALQNLLDMVLLQMVNNPWRSRLWGVPAFLVICFNILNFGKMVFADSLVVTEPQFVEEVQLLDRALKILYGIFALCWIALLCLLMWVLWAANFDDERALDSVEYTRRLLRSKAHTDTPARFQAYADALSVACDQQDLAFCAQAALRIQTLREAERAVESPDATNTPQTGLLVRAAALLRFQKLQESARASESTTIADERQAGLLGRVAALLRRRAPPAGVDGSVARSAVQVSSPEEEYTSTDSTARQSSLRGLRSLDRLPSLASVSLLLSALLVIIACTFVVYLATLSKVISVAGAYGVNQTAMQAAQASEATVLQAQELRNFTGQAAEHATGVASTLPALSDRLVESQQGLTQAVASLEQVAQQLEAMGSADVAASLRQTVSAINALPLQDEALMLTMVESISAATVALAYIPAVHDSLEGIEVFAQGIVDQVKRLNVHVRYGTEWVERLGRSSEVTLIISALIGLPLALGIIDWTRRSWRGLLEKVKTGAQRQSPYWEPQLFDPVRAPTLPGLMASSVLLAFCSVTLLLFVLMESVIMAVHSGWQIPWDDLGSMALGSGTMLVVKVLVLDKLARRYLTTNGFVTAWARFAWFVSFTLPFYALTSILAAIYRFIVLVGIGFAYVAAVHTTLLPPNLQSMDPGWTASMSMLVMAHRHNSPINFTVSRAFLGDGLGHDLTKTRAQKNWKLAVTMVRNPELGGLRRNQVKEEPCVPSQGPEESLSLCDDRQVSL